MNSCRSALILVLGSILSNDNRFKKKKKKKPKRVYYRLKPPQPKYSVTWDTNLILDKLYSWYPNEELSLEKLTNKTVKLLALPTIYNTNYNKNKNEQHLKNFTSYHY